MRSISLILCASLCATITMCGFDAFAASSAEIRDAVAHQLDDTKLGKHEIDIEVRGTVVTLTGQVASNADRRTVEEIATNTNGVERLESRLEVVPGKAGNASELARAVWNALQNRNDLGTYKIQILANGSAVTITGSAASTGTREAIERTARSVPGVASVLNQINVNG